MDNLYRVAWEHGKNLTNLWEGPKTRMNVHYSHYHYHYPIAYKAKVHRM